MSHARNEESDIRSKNDQSHRSGDNDTKDAKDISASFNNFECNMIIWGKW